MLYKYGEYLYIYIYLCMYMWWICLLIALLYIHTVVLSFQLAQQALLRRGNIPRFDVSALKVRAEGPVHGKPIGPGPINRDWAINRASIGYQYN